MAEFVIRFFIWNIFISFIIGIFLSAKRLLRDKLTRRMHYNLWFLLLGLLAVPFLPIQSAGFLQVFAWFDTLKSVSPSPAGAVGLVLCLLWGAGIAGLVLLTIHSILRFNSIRKSALPLQNPDVIGIYRGCLHEMHITRPVPVYSTAFLKSPVIAGLLRPCIYLPIHLISDFNANDIRYMLLHELVHYKYKDALANYCINVIGILYWFNPLVWYSLKEMKNDREVACDTSVLKLLREDSYGDYGITLIQFAEKVSLTPFPFAAGISGSMKQMQRRVLNIANYRPASFREKLHGTFVYIMTAVFLSGTVPRTAPASTFKIYSALFGLESGTITPEQSVIPWNGHQYAYDLWNADQTLQSAMRNSVTWYFQELDRQASLSSIKEYVQEIGYGNQLVEGDTSSYWLNSSLKISPVEQVELLQKLYYNQFGFSPENINAVKDSIRLYSTDQGTLSGKTGTVEERGKNTSGWFIGYVEQGRDTCFFATNIQSDKPVSGPLATELTFSILSDLNMWNDVQK